MVSAQQYLIVGKFHTARCCVDKIGELTRSLSTVTTQLIDLTGSGLYMQKRAIFHGLLYGCVNHPWMSGTNGIDTAFSRQTVVDQ
jgi:hypothetical protein